jgi:multiple sugar transport system ATP-binding protein
VPLGKERLDSCLAGKVTEVGIRPENLELVAPDQPCAMAGEVYVVEPMGNETLIDVRIGSERATVRARRGFRARIGTPVGVRFDPVDASFFDQSGLAVVHRAPNKGGNDET